MKQSILIVDDTPENLSILSNILSEDYNVRLAISGEIALKIANSDNPPDLILLDIILPGIDGYAVFKELKANQATSSIPVMFITVMNDEDSELKALNMGAVDFIKKPFYPVLVKSRVYNQLQLKKYRDSLERLVESKTREIIKTQDVTFKAFASLAETRDHETGAHIQRTQEYMRILAASLSGSKKYGAFFTAKNTDILIKSAPLHDIGKIGVPDSILLKPAKLTAQEFQEIKKHTVLGYKILNAIVQELSEDNDFKLAPIIAYTHHEHWNGLGYPRGLKEEEIPIVGRMMALVDVYDALISKRVYKPAVSHDETVEIILSAKGTQFDPYIIDVFMELENSFKEIALKYND